MDSIFGIGIPELILILVIAGLVLGPKQIQAIARNLGRFIGGIRNMSGDLREIARAVSTELDTIDDVKAAKQDLATLQQQLTALQKDINVARQELLKDTTGSVAQKSVAQKSAAQTPAPDQSAQPPEQEARANRFPENGNQIAPPMPQREPAPDDEAPVSAEAPLPNPIAVPDDEP